MLDDLTADYHRHNRFLLDTELPHVDISSEEFSHICGLIVKYNVHSVVRIRHLHRHITVPEGHILLGTRINKPFGYWIRPTPILDIDLHKIRPHILSVHEMDSTTEGRNTKERLVPSEFREGLPIDIDRNFLTEFANYVRKKSLENKFGLEAIEGHSKKMIEFSFDCGSILLEENEVTPKIGEAGREFTLRDTSWTVTIKDDLVDQTGETRCLTYTTGHVKVTNEPAKSVSDVVNILRVDGFLVM